MEKILTYLEVDEHNIFVDHFSEMVDRILHPGVRGMENLLGIIFRRVLCWSTG